MTTREIIKKFGVGRIADAIGKSESSVKEARRAGVFPPSWYPLVKKLCDTEGVECPLDAFSFAEAPASDVAPEVAAE